mmetsp:Transcript_46177/g.75360  ORF Transcript_46177/g.75360 Transcript_46177/m.75360 type:complete len:184 (+) Transcript_46177:727-1278(+)
MPTAPLSQLPLPLILMLLDFLKAYDKVAHLFLLKALEYFGFGPFAIACFQTLYSKREAFIRTRFGCTNNYKIKCGVIQGGPLSCIMYVVDHELIVNGACRTAAITGPSHPLISAEIKVVSFADDTEAFLNGLTALIEFVLLLKRYSRASSAAINWPKSKFLLLGSMEGKEQEVLPAPPTSHPT